MVIKAQIYKEIVELADKLLDARKIPGIAWMQYKYSNLHKRSKSELIKIKQELEKMR